MRNLLLSALVLAFTVPVAGSWVAGASDPARAAPDADHIIHGTIIGVEQCSSGAPSFQATNATGTAPSDVERNAIDPSTIDAPSHCGLWDTIRGFLMQLF